MSYKIPEQVVKMLHKNFSCNAEVLSKAKFGAYEWELCHNQAEGFYLVRWDKQGFGTDYEIPESLSALLGKVE